MKKLFYAAYLSLLLSLPNSCETEHVTPQIRQTHFSQHQQSSGACSLFPTLDRSVLGTSVTRPSEDDLRVIAGFVTTFAGGAPPIPCNKLNLAVVSGRFSFDLSTINPERLERAFIVADNFTPIGENRIVEAIPWGISGGWIGAPGTIHDFCKFKVKFVTDIPATSREFLSHPPPTRELVIGDQIFSIANGGSGSRYINVTSEIRSQLKSARDRQFFLVEPADIAMAYQASNRFLGFFTFRLIVHLNP
ncbi:MAG: hypothetical protein H7Y86_09020 [Rhizobacter sp.]|nr:hypothetical protein [Ferruginibacter sp.]